MSAAFKSTFAFVVIMNIIGFVLIKTDKKRLLSKKPRIREVLLFVIAGLGGGVGELLSMAIFRHKTYKWYFKLFMPIIAIINIIVTSLLLYLMFEAGVGADVIV